MQTFRDFLTTEELNTVTEILGQPGWGFGFISNDKNKPIWNFDKDKARPIAELLLDHLPDYELDDFHINGQTMAQTAAVHTDNQGRVTHTLVYFPFSWNYTWGGRLHVLENDIACCVTPEWNTAVIFDASAPHYAEGPTENKLRISVGLKLRKI